MALPLSSGGGIPDSSPEKGASVEWACRAISGECASRCATRGKLKGPTLRSYVLVDVMQRLECLT